MELSELAANMTPIEALTAIVGVLKYRRKSPDVSPWMEWVPTESDMRSMHGRIPRT